MGVPIQKRTLTTWGGQGHASPQIVVVKYLNIYSKYAIFIPPCIKHLHFKGTVI